MNKLPKAAIVDVLRFAPTPHLRTRWWVERGDQMPNTKLTLVPGPHSPTPSMFGVLLFLVSSSWKVLKVYLCV